MAPHSTSPIHSDHGPLPRETRHPNGASSTAWNRAHTSEIDNGSQRVHESKHHRSGRSRLQSTSRTEVHDCVCVGFGPASLAIAIALHDALDPTDPSAQLSACRNAPPKVAFLERQPHFAWHAGMLLPGAKMQISFIKDLATLRNPRSEFTFLNYLHRQGRLVQFTNLGTFLPLRVEMEDYMRWCAGFFEDVVQYRQQVLDIIPEKETGEASPVSRFLVRSRDAKTGEIQTLRSRNVIIAVGGKPQIPKCLPQNHPRVVHSSAYLRAVPEILPNRERSYRCAVIGSGQSAAEIFHDLCSRYPAAQVSLFIKGSALRPSDDSPFVNEIFDPARIDGIYQQWPDLRQASITQDRATNYGVVRLELLEEIYAHLYSQRVQQPDESKWQHQILPHRAIADWQDVPDDDRVRLRIERQPGDGSAHCRSEAEMLDADVVFVATGYVRNAHEDLLRSAEDLTPQDGSEEGVWKVGRDYRVAFEPGKVNEDAGIWLQGCNEASHGLSDTLLSVLATRSGELVQSIFGSRPF
ncbi:MAG: hypothetical protein M1817_003046 [Caeruleum heppii]|nr:MAG: hypothetical protein M1817_003046 [Caeruleum heppii]